MPYNHHRSSPPPQEAGERIATFRRHAAGEELRVNLCEYLGHPFVYFRVWAPGFDGTVRPVKGKGVSVKLREVPALAEALTRLAAAIAAEQGTAEAAAEPDQAGAQPAARSRARDWRSAALPPEDVEDFDELA